MNLSGFDYLVPPWIDWPIYFVWFFGLIVVVRHWHRHPRACVQATAALFALLFLSGMSRAMIMTGVMYSPWKGANRVMQFLSAVGFLVIPLLNALAAGVLLHAVFIGRRPPPTEAYPSNNDATR